MERNVNEKNVWILSAIAFAAAVLMFAIVLSGCSTADVGASDAYESSTTSALGTPIFEDDQGNQSIEADENDEATSAEKDALDFEKSVQMILGELTLREKIYQMFIVTHEQITGVSCVTRSGEQTKEAIERHPVGGIIYFEPNIVSPEQCSGMIENLQSFSELGLFIAVDEEGGRVARLGNNPDMNTTAFPGGQAAIGKTGDPVNARKAGKTIGLDISQYGFNLNLAPVAELTDDTEHAE